MAETIKEFLVSLGWHVNQADQDKFYRALEGAVLRANLLSAALEGAARNIALKVADIAESFEDLNYQMQRTGASVATIRALEYAVSQLGGTVQGAGSSIDTFGRLLRTNPGERSWVETFFGISTKGKDTAQVMLDIGAAASKMYQPLVQGAGVLGQLGWDEKTMLALEKGPEAMSRYNEEMVRQGQAGIGDQTAEQATKFDQAARKIAAVAEDLMVGGESKIMASLVGPLTKLGDFLDQHSDAINDAFDDIAAAVGEFAKEWEGKFEKLDWKAIGTSMEGIATSVNHGADAIGGLTKALEDLALLWAGSKLASIFAVLRSLGLLNPYAIAGGAALSLGGDTGGADVTDAQRAAAQAQYDQLNASQGGFWGSAKSWWRKTAPSWLGGGGAATGAKGALKGNQQTAYDAARAEGLSDTAARAVVANASGESLANPADMHWDVSHNAHGIVQWDDVRSARIKAQFGKLPNEMTIPEQIKAHIWEMKNYYPDTWAALQGSDPNAMIAALVNYEGPADKAGAYNTRSGYYKGFTPAAPPLPSINQNATPWSKSSFNASPSFWGGFNAGDLSNAIAGAPSLGMAAAGAQITSSQVNHIHVETSDPQSAAAMVGLHLDRTATDITRNLQGNIQ